MKSKFLNMALLSFLIGSLTLYSCKDDSTPVDKPDEHNEEEVITSLELHLTDSANQTNKLMFAFRDKDGDGGAAPTQFDTIRLEDSTTYIASIILLNESETPADTISNEVKEEADEHLFCFTPSGNNLSVDITDNDGALPLGLESKWTAVTAGNGTVKILLKHQPDAKTGSCDPGETDIELDFQYEIKN